MFKLSTILFLQFIVFLTQPSLVNAVDAGARPSLNLLPRLDLRVEETLTDRALIAAAHEHDAYRNVGVLEGEIYVPGIGTKQIFSGSAVYLGGVTVITSAHCVDPWLNFMRGTFRALYFKVERPDGTFDRYRISDGGIVQHPLWKSCDIDVALLRLEAPIEGLPGIEPAYGVVPEKEYHYYAVEGTKIASEVRIAEVSGMPEPANASYGRDFLQKKELWERLRRQKVAMVGYGHSAMPGHWLGHNDEKRRLTMTTISIIDNWINCKQDVPEGEPDSRKQYYFISEQSGFTSEMQDSRYVQVPRNVPLHYELPMRHGMSGGAVFSENGFIGLLGVIKGINYEASFAKKCFDNIKNLAREHVCKYTAALGIPSPFLGTAGENTQNYFINFTAIKDWIDDHRREWLAATTAPVRPPEG